MIFVTVVTANKHTTTVCFIDCTGIVQNHIEYKKSYRETKYYINSHKAEHNQKENKQNDI